MNTSENILKFLRDYIRRHGYSPTIREIAEAMGISSTNTITYHLNTLVEKGRIRRTPRIARGLVLVK